MSDELTDQELAEMEARANAATPGPWLTDVSLYVAPVHDEHFDRFYNHVRGERDNAFHYGMHIELTARCEVGKCPYCEHPPVQTTQKPVGAKIAGQLLNVTLTYHSHLLPCPDTDVLYAANGDLVFAVEYDDAPNHKANTRFAAHARTDIPRLIAEVRRLRGIVEDQCPYCD